MVPRRRTRIQPRRPDQISEKPSPRREASNGVTRAAFAVPFWYSSLVPVLLVSLRSGAPAPLYRRHMRLVPVWWSKNLTSPPGMLVLTGTPDGARRRITPTRRSTYLLLTELCSRVVRVPDTAARLRNERPALRDYEARSKTCSFLRTLPFCRTFPVKCRCPSPSNHGHGPFDGGSRRIRVFAATDPYFQPHSDVWLRLRRNHRRLAAFWSPPRFRLCARVGCALLRTSQRYP